MELIDTHAHLYSSQFRDDLNNVVKQAKEAGVTKAFMPNVDSASISDLHKLAELYPDFCIPMMGLHPCSVKADYKRELAIVEKNLGEGKYIAVGEIGLDYYWDKTFIQEQQEAFITQVNWAKELNLPIAIHTRESFDDAVKLLQTLQDGNLRGVFHCFTGTYEDAQKVIELGFYMGIGGVVTFKNSEIAKAIQQIDLKHLVLETDAPYLAPTPHRGKRNESAYIKLVAEKIAVIKNLSFEEVAAATSAIARTLFKPLD
ncbi:MAG: TatD family hydrolase [Chitinophagales bacterium]|nr:TatD family hydrolase [Chitinophagales bacterium]